MYYYKVIYGEAVVGVTTSDDCAKLKQRKNKTYLPIGCDLTEAELFCVNQSEYYHDSWMLGIAQDFNGYTNATIVEIQQPEYEAIKKAFETNDTEQLNDFSDVEDVSDDVIEPAGAEDKTAILTIEYLKNKKISEVSAVCNTVITSGIDVTLSDGNSYHFSLSTSDQIMISSLAIKAAQGASALPWHSDGDLCKYYSSADILTISSAMEETITYHTTYFNSLKHYVQSLETVEEVSNIYYGIDIPEEYQSEVLKMCLAQLALKAQQAALAQAESNLSDITSQVESSVGSTAEV